VAPRSFEVATTAPDPVQLNQQLESTQQLLELRESQLAQATSVEAEYELLKQQLVAMEAKVMAKDDHLASLRHEVEKLSQQLIDAAKNTPPQPEAVLGTTEHPENQAQSQAHEVAASPEFQTAAHLFAAEPSTQLADLFRPINTFPTGEPHASHLLSEVPSAAGLFAADANSPVDPFAASDSLTAAEGSDLTMQTLEQQQQQQQPQSFDEYQAWYQQELETYQQAINQWQAWGEEKGAEVSQLQASLTTLNEALSAANQEIESLKTTVAASDTLAPQSGHDKVNEMLKLMRIKDLELEELRETIDRLETEKTDLSGEVAEALEQVAELEAVRDQVEAHQATVQLLEETKAGYDRIKEEEHRLRWGHLKQKVSLFKGQQF
jgi:chromosome segregation ATPase